MLDVRLIIVIGLLLFSCIEKTCAQILPYAGHIGSEDGLISQLCTNIAEDTLGNLWINSFQGIQKYNGYNVEVFSTGNENNLRRGVDKLFADSNGNIWVFETIVTSKENENKKYLHKTGDYLISLIDPLTNQITKFDDLASQPDLKQENISLIQFLDNTIYFFTREKEVYTFTDQLKFHCKIRDLDNFVTIDSSGNFIHLIGNELLYYDKNEQLVSKIDSSTFSRIDGLVRSDYSQLFFLKQNHDHVVIQEFDGNNFISLKEVDDSSYNSLALRHWKIKTYADGSILINNNFFHKNSETHLILRNSRGNNQVFNYLVSTSGLSYLSTNMGVYILKNGESPFNLLANSPLNSVRGIFNNEKLKIYRNQDELEVIESHAENLDLSFLDTIDLGPLASMHYIDPLNEDHLWSVGYVKNNLRRIDLKQKTIEYIKIYPTRPFLTNNIHRSSKTNKLYLTAITGVFLYDEEKNLFNKLKLDCISQDDIAINQIIEHSNKLLLATSLGVISLNEQNHSCKLEPLTIDSTSYGIQFIHRDNSSEEILWLGSQRGGLAKWNTTNETYTFYNTENGLSNNDIHAILEDSNERLWISTNRNLNCLNKESGEIFIFTEQDGITHSEFNRFSYFHDSINNHMYFGGLSGYTYFNPDSISTENNQNKIKLRLIDVIKTTSDASTENIYIRTQQSQSIDFLDDDVSLHLYLTTNNLANTKNTNYSYRILGLMDNWETQSSNDIKLNRLPYGKYEIEIIADLNRPSLTSDILTIKLDVIQPFRKTWTAYILGFLLFLLIIWIAVQKYLQNIRNRNDNLTKLVSERTKELQELNQQKSKIFTILSHDLRNPIASLTDISEKMKFLAGNNRLHEIDILAEQTKEKISALNDNLNNILLWALSENKMISLKAEKLSLKLEIKKILELYSTQVKDKELSTFDNLDIVDQVKLDVTVLQTILRNIINNAVKYSHKGGEIKFTKSAETANRICLTIKDQGIGFDTNKEHNMSAEKIHTEHKEGFGLGLKIARDLANMSGVIIKIHSSPQNGTEVILDFPKI